MMDHQKAAQIQRIRRRAIGPVGTAARVCLGLGLLYFAIFDGAFRWGLQWHDVLLGLLGFPAVIILGVLLWKALTGSSAPIPGMGPLGYCATTGVFFALFTAPFTQEATALFVGSSLLLAAARGYAGCEVAAITNWLLRRDDQVGCVVFSPLDEAEAHFSHNSSEVRL